MSFRLKIVTPDGLQYDGMAEQLVVRTTTGDVGILARHTNLVAPLGMGKATVVINGEERLGACIGGILSVVNGEVNLVPTTFEWQDKIDPHRAEASAARAREELSKKDASGMEVKLAEARLKRALVRIGVANAGKTR